MADTSDVLRYKVPAQLKGKVVTSEHIMDFFNLPRIIGTNTDGSEISADIGRFGPYLKCGSDFRSLKDVEEIFAVTESEARKIFSVPKEKKDGGTKRSSVRNAKPVSDKTAPVKDFGEYEGAALAIRSGRYGFYLKHGDRNIRIADKYQHDEDACRQMSLEEAVEYLKK